MALHRYSCRCCLVTAPGRIHLDHLSSYCYKHICLFVVDNEEQRGTFGQVVLLPDSLPDLYPPAVADRSLGVYIGFGGGAATETHDLSSLARELMQLRESGVLTNDSLDVSGLSD